MNADLQRARALEGRGRWFELINLPRGADEGLVRKACRDVRVRCHPDKTDTPVELAQILNQAADRVSRLLLEPFDLYARHTSHTTFTTPQWAAQFESDLLRARAARDSDSFERTFAAYSHRMDELLEERREKRRRFEEDCQRAAEEDAQRRKRRRAELRRLRYKANVRGSAKYDPLLATAKRAREAARRRLGRRGERATDEDREAVRAAGEAVAREVAESVGRRGQARVEMAVQRSTFPRLTKRFAEAHPEAATRIRELSRLHYQARRGADYRRHDREHQQRLMARRESLLREAWAVACA
jgi:curved DNA-binding protein CbpA